MKQKTYYIITIGCQMNKSDSERIAGYLEDHGYVLSLKKEKADLIVVTTCGVRQSAEDRAYGIVHNLNKNNQKVKIILAGCLSKREDVKKRLKNSVDIWMPITELENLAHKLGLEKNENSSLSGYLAINPKYNSHFSAFVPIGNGCDNFCSYCVVPHARGREVYRDVNEILDEVKRLVKKGYKEITLIAQNVNSYKGKLNKKLIKFPELLKMIDNIDGDFWIRFSTSHPKDMSDELIRTIAKSKKICKHIHLPVQSGDNEILKRMNRKYTREHYIKLIKRIRKIIPEVLISTDTIVGFPGEDKKQFNNTSKLYKECKFDLAYISQYSPRPGTASAKMEDDVSKTEKKRREEELIKILRKTALNNNKKYRGKSLEVLIEGKNKKGEYYGKTRTCRHVKVSKNKNIKIGEFIKIKILKVKDFGLEGKYEK